MSGAVTLVTHSTDLTPIDTPFGTFDGRPRDIVTLVEGLPGFEDSRQFLVLYSPALEPLACFQGVDASRPSFLVVDPRFVDPDYSCRLDDLQRQRLGATLETPLLWLAIVRIAEGGTTVNLRAPLVVNPERMRGLQLLAGHDDYDTNHPLG